MAGCPLLKISQVIHDETTSQAVEHKIACPSDKRLQFQALPKLQALASTKTFICPPYDAVRSR
jgi:hypothetical protein